MKYMITAIVLLLATEVTAEDNRKWYAMAYPDEVGRYDSYGVAWNFPTRAAAVSAAVAECEKRSRSKCKEYFDNVDHDHCFAIIRGGYRRKAPNFYFHTGPEKFFQTGRERKNSLFQTEEEARRLATEEVGEWMRRYAQWQQWDLELVACSGDPGNRRANQ